MGPDGVVILKWVYAQPVSTLARELISLRTGRKARRGGRRPPPAPRIREPRYIEERPDEASARAVPGHWEGDLVIGKDGKTAVATLVERVSRFLILVPFTNNEAERAVRPVKVENDNPIWPHCDGLIWPHLDSCGDGC